MHVAMRTTAAACVSGFPATFTPDLPPFSALALANSHTSRLPQLPPTALLSVTQHCARDTVFAPKLLEIAQAPLRRDYLVTSTPVLVSCRIHSGSVCPTAVSPVVWCSACGKATGKAATSSEDGLALRRSSDIFVFMSLSTFGSFSSSWGKIAAVSNILSDPRSLVVNKQSSSAEDAVETRLG